MVTGIIAYLGLDPKGGWHETEPYLVSKDTQYISEINVHVLNSATETWRCLSLQHSLSYTDHYMFYSRCRLFKKFPRVHEAKLRPKDLKNWKEQHSRGKSIYMWRLGAGWEFSIFGEEVLCLFTSLFFLLGAGAWGWPREMLWGGRWEGGSCLGTHVRI